jgi:hypothetical protein
LLLEVLEKHVCIYLFLFNFFFYLGQTGKETFDDIITGENKHVVSGSIIAREKPV